MLNKVNYAPPTSHFIVLHADGSTEGRDPRLLTPAELAVAGHIPQPILRVIRFKCLDCCGGSRTEVSASTAVSCALWPYRLGANPFAKARGLSYTGPDRSSEKVPQFADVSGGKGPPNSDGGAQ
jgi:hypothetical protein